MNEKDLEQLKKEAAQKAREAAMRKLAEKKAKEEMTVQEKAESENVSQQEQERATNSQTASESANAAEGSEATSRSADEKAKAAAAAKAKAAAAAKAKAAAAAKAKASGAGASADEKAKAAAAAKAKAAAAAKAKAAAAAKAKASGAGASADEKAKAVAAAKAKAAAAAKAKAAAAAKGEESSVEEQKPSVNQPYLDKYLKVIEEHLGKDVLEDAYINRLSKDVPTLVIKTESYFKVAEFLKFNEQLSFDYLSETHGTDFETHFEIYSHLYSFKNKQSVAIKVKVDRDNPQIESLTPLWPGANWPEREAYDLLGIQFTGHPNLKRILLPDDWVGHPLRKDYEPYDVEV